MLHLFKKGKHIVFVKIIIIIILLQIQVAHIKIRNNV